MKGKAVILHIDINKGVFYNYYICAQINAHAGEV